MFSCLLGLILKTGIILCLNKIKIFELYERLSLKVLEYLVGQYVSIYILKLLPERSIKVTVHNLRKIKGCLDGH